MTWTMTLHLPIVVTNPLNGNGKHQWTQARKRKRERMDTASLLAAYARSQLPRGWPEGWRVQRVAFERRGWNAMDEVGLLAALKSIQDEVADFLGVDDRPGTGIEWRFTQVRTRDRDAFGVHVTIDLESIGSEVAGPLRTG